MKKILAAAAAVIALIIGGIVMMFIALFMFFGADDNANAVAVCEGSEVVAPDQSSEWTPDQVEYVQTIASVGTEMGVSEDGQVIAVMTAIQESTLRNLANPSIPESLDHPHDDVGHNLDTLGMFQQRPAAGWGTVDELMTPRYQAEAFYGGPAGPNGGSPRGLLDVSGWESMTLNDAAQEVQVSETPNAYGQWEEEARDLIAQVGGSVECSDEVPEQEADDDYPWPDAAPLDQGGSMSPLAYGYRECVDFVAWRINRDAGVGPDGPWKYTWSNLTPGGGHAIQWKQHWENKGWEVTNTPKTGYVAWWGTSASQWGHVAYVQSVLPDGRVVIEEYNFGFDHNYNQRTLNPDEIEAFLGPPQ